MLTEAVDRIRKSSDNARMRRLLQIPILVLITVGAIVISPLTLASAVWLAGTGLLPLTVLLLAAVPVAAIWAMTVRRSRPSV
jgi:hypothetical protein